MTTHADLLAAIDKVREWCIIDGTPGDDALYAAHLDTLRAILDLHTPWQAAPTTVRCDDCENNYPCPTVQVVADALTRMGALPTVVDVTHDMQIDDPLDDDYEPAIDVDGYPT